MSFIIPAGRNATLADAWAKHKAAQKAESKAAKKAEPMTKADVHRKPPNVAKVAPDVHKKAGKVHTTAAKKAAKKRGARK